MPTLPLLTDPPNPNGSHRLLAPGGYEGWSFDASSDDGALHLVAGLHAADALDADYARAYARYRRRPTRVTPPAPGDFAAVTFALFEKGRQPVRFTARGTAAGEVLIAPTGDSVRIGGSHGIRSPDGRSVQLNLRGVDDGRTIAVNLTFRSLGPVDREVALLGPAATRPGVGDDLGDDPRRASGDGHTSGDGREPHGDGRETHGGDQTGGGHGTRGGDTRFARGFGLHRWVIADPMCDVNGEIAIFDGTGGPPRTVPLAGSGFCDHAYGTRPLAGAAAVWFTGRAIFEDRVIAFRQVGDAAEGHLVTAIARAAAVTASAPVSDATESAATVETTFSRVPVDEALRAAARRRVHADRIDLGPLHLEYPQVLDAGEHERVVLYTASAAGQRGTALCRVLQPPAVRSRFLWG